MAPVTSLSKFAKDCLRVSPAEVSKACSRGGRLERSKGVQRGPDGRVCAIDWEIAKADWAANSDYTDAPQRVERPRDPSPDLGQGKTDPTTLAEASVEQKKWQAKLAELKYREQAGELVPAKDVAVKIRDVFSSCRTKLLGIPSRIKQTLPALTVKDIGTIENLVREALEELAS